MHYRLHMVEKPEEFVNENSELIKRVLKHSDDEFARACALAILINSGSSTDVHQIKNEIRDAEDFFG